MLKQLTLDLFTNTPNATSVFKEGVIVERYQLGSVKWTVRRRQKIPWNENSPSIRKYIEELLQLSDFDVAESPEKTILLKKGKVCFEFQHKRFHNPLGFIYIYDKYNIKFSKNVYRERIWSNLTYCYFIPPEEAIRLLDLNGKDILKLKLAEILKDHVVIIAENNKYFILEDTISKRNALLKIRTK